MGGAPFKSIDSVLQTHADVTSSSEVKRTNSLSMVFQDKILESYGNTLVTNDIQIWSLSIHI